MGTAPSRQRRVLIGGVVGAVAVMAVALLWAFRAPEEAPGSYPPADWRSDAVDGARATRIARLGEVTTGLASDPDVSVLFVATRFGRILSIPIEEVYGRRAPAPELTRVAIDLSSSLSTQDERGLLGIQALPNSDRVAISYTAVDGAVTVRLLRIDGARLVDDVADPVVLAVPHPYAGHNGGGLTVDTAGDLYLSIGDMDTRDLVNPAAQDPTSLLGGVVRLPYGATQAEAVRPLDPDPSLLVAKGLRNPWRVSVDVARDDLWIGDVGQDRFEEVDVIPNVSSIDGPVDFGWPAVEADEPMRADLPVSPNSVGPAAKLVHDDTTCSISLGGVYAGQAVASLRDRLILGDLCSDQVSAFTVGGQGPVDRETVAGVSSGIVSFGQDADGEVYAMTLDGDVYRLDPGNWTARGVSGQVRLPEVAASPDQPSAEEPSAEECILVDELEGMVRFQELSPEDLRVGLARLTSALREASAAAAPPRRQAIERLIQSFDEFSRAADAASYAVAAPEVTSLMAELIAGTGRGEGFPDAMTSVMSASPDCP